MQLREYTFHLELAGIWGLGLEFHGRKYGNERIRKKGRRTGTGSEDGSGESKDGGEGDGLKVRISGKRTLLGGRYLIKLNSSVASVWEVLTQTNG